MLCCEGMEEEKRLIIKREVSWMPRGKYDHEKFPPL